MSVFRLVNGLALVAVLTGCAVSNEAIWRQHIEIAAGEICRAAAPGDNTFGEVQKITYKPDGSIGVSCVSVAADLEQLEQHRTTTVAVRQLEITLSQDPTGKTVAEIKNRNTVNNMELVRRKNGMCDVTLGSGQPHRPIDFALLAWAKGLCTANR